MRDLSRYHNMAIISRRGTHLYKSVIQVKHKSPLKFKVKIQNTNSPQLTDAAISTSEMWKDKKVYKEELPVISDPRLNWHQKRMDWHDEFTEPAPLRRELYKVARPFGLRKIFKIIRWRIVRDSIAVHPEYY
jgi:hypothetical protein